MSAPLRAQYRPRPVRIAYLVDEGAEHNAVILDAIFAECMGRWGGRFSLVVPSDRDGPSSNYWAWLEAFDPDVIYSYVDISTPAQEQIHERIYPSFLIAHERLGHTELDSNAFRPRLPVSGLSVTTLLPRAAAPRLDRAGKIRVSESIGLLSQNRFLRDSVGFFTESVGRSFPAYMHEFASELILVADDEAQPRERFVRPEASTVPSVATFVQAMATTNLISMSLLSATAAPRLEFRSTRMSAFNLVVGDSFDDRVFYWNARSLYPRWRDGDLVDLRLSVEAVEDERIIAAVGQLLQRRARVTVDQSSDSRVTLRSSSVSSDKLKVIAEQLRKEAKWITFSTGYASLDGCIPSKAELATGAYVVSEDMFANRANLTWQETVSADDHLNLPTSAPEHLRYCPPSMLTPHNGCWAVDVGVERKNSYSQYENVQQRWVFPRRLRLTSAFIRGYELTGAGGGHVMPRVSQPGWLTVYADGTSKLPPISLPTDELAFFVALTRGRDWWPFSRTVGPKAQEQQQLLTDVARSSSGRQLWGVIGLFGDLNAAQRILLNGLWRKVFASLGGTTAYIEVHREKIVNQLTKRVHNFDASATRDLESLASIVMEEAENFRSNVPSISWDELSVMFQEHQASDWETEAAEHLSDSEKVEWKKHEAKRFRRKVQGLCERGVLHQGYEHRCWKCLHRSWIAIDVLGRTVVCEVCQEAEQAPVDRPWDFRLNEFLREAIRKHGILPLVWALAKMRTPQEGSFYFDGPLDVYTEGFSYDGARRTTDIDILAVRDGKVIMCEVKQSGRQLYNSELDDFADLMKRLRPDVAMIAVMEPDNRKIRASFERFSARLSGTGISPQLLTFDDRQDIEQTVML